MRACARCFSGFCEGCAVVLTALSDKMILSQFINERSLMNERALIHLLTSAH